MGGINIYSTRKNWKIILFIFATIICLASLTYTNKLVRELDIEERKKIELWAEATNQLVNSGMGPTNNILASRIMQENTTIPIILTNEVGEIIGNRNLPNRPNQEAFLQKQLKLMAEQHEPIIIEAKMNGKVILTQYLYYKDSYILSQLRFYPLLQLIVIFLYIGIAYLAFNRSKRSEQNLVWAGMAKETAHQIGTPLSSLMAWVEILKNKEGMTEISDEINKDVKRLETITERFSKVGSKPNLEPQSIFNTLSHTVAYLQNRLSSNVSIELDNQCNDSTAPINSTLFEWVVENICKNAADAMNGKGLIKINLFSESDYIKIDITDSGKGLQKANFKRIFEPGFTTKKRGWGLGLSLSKRIIEDYHLGKLYVKSSSKNGTTFRISLHRN
ncbi:ATP-binding protein [Flavobacteriales bacterium]|jgi:anti-sigma regulatory factor (Ser/Thr protein kinase)|nr:ATP-binding protein [Flavobacteriales bacterium]